MQATDRVRVEDPVFGPLLGTVLRVSPAGYAVVQWDRLDGEVHLSPKFVEERLTVVTGEAALHRHDWTDEDICRRCLVRWSSERMDEPCYQLHQDGAR